MIHLAVVESALKKIVLSVHTATFAEERIAMFAKITSVHTLVLDADALSPDAVEIGIEDRGALRCKRPRLRVFTRVAPRSRSTLRHAAVLGRPVPSEHRTPVRPRRVRLRGPSRGGHSAGVRGRCRRCARCCVAYMPTPTLPQFDYMTRVSAVVAAHPDVFGGVILMEWTDQWWRAAYDSDCGATSLYGHDPCGYQVRAVPAAQQARLTIKPTIAL
jgi:hypothetical protein